MIGSISGIIRYFYKNVFLDIALVIRKNIFQLTKKFLKKVSTYCHSNIRMQTLGCIHNNPIDSILSETDQN